MKPNSRYQMILVAALTLQLMALLAFSGCSDRDLATLPEATAPANGLVFGDGFSGGLDYSAFEFSYYEAMTVETSGGYEDSGTIKVTIPAGNWAGGAFYSQGSRDLSSFNALTLYAKSSEPLSLGDMGFGIPIVAPSDNQVSVSGVALTEAWKLITIPIPDPSRLTGERGMFWYSQGNGGVGIWFDEIEFKKVSNITNPRPVMNSGNIEALLGEQVPITGTQTTYAVDDEDMVVVHTPSYFTYTSSDETVVLAENGSVTAVGGGTATITAALVNGSITTPVEGEITVTVIAPPTIPAPEPTVPEGDVISIFSDAYATNTNVTTWRTDWSSASTAVFDQAIEGDNVKAYTGLTSPLFYVGVDFVSDQIDAETPGMTDFHLDVYAPTGTTFGVKLVDFGPDGGFGGGDDTERLLIFTPASDPAFVAGEWLSLDIPLTDFTGMNFGAVSQMVFTNTNCGNVWIDNVYFHK